MAYATSLLRCSEIGQESCQTYRSIIVFANVKYSFDGLVLQCGEVLEELGYDLRGQLLLLLVALGALDGLHILGRVLQKYGCYSQCRPHDKQTNLRCLVFRLRQDIVNIVQLIERHCTHFLPPNASRLR